MPGLSQSILVQCISSLLQHCPRVDERVVIHELAILVGADLTYDLDTPRFQRQARACLKRSEKAGLTSTRSGEICLTAKGWERSKLASPKTLSTRPPVPPRDLAARVESWVRRAAYRAIRADYLTLSAYRCGKPAILTKIDLDRAVKGVLDILGNKVTRLSRGRIRENFIEVRSPLLMPPSSFRDPVLKAMALRGEGRQEQVLPKSAIIADALRFLGLSSEGCDLRQLAGRVLRGMRVGSSKLVEVASPQLWILTPDGYARSAPLLVRASRETRRPEENLTARWIREHDGKGLRVEVAKKIVRKCPISSRIGAVDDHVQEFFARLIKRDSLRERLEAGMCIPYSLVASWGVRSAFVDFRNAGTEPICREQHGARTEKEVKQYRKAGEETPAPARKSGMTQLANLSDPTSASVEETIWFNQFWGRFEGIVRDKFPGEAELYLRVLRAKLDEDSVASIAARVGVNERRVRGILKNVGGLRAAAFRD